MLIIDSQPYSQKDQSLENRKKDIGLYGMNFGNAYVASVAVYSSYTQVMHAMVEAQQFDGPSIVLAYLPYTSELDSPLQLLQETKIAVDSGYWPLYRWSPASEPNSEPVFQLDSERVKKELKAFIDRENHLTHLVKSTAAISTTVSHSHGSELRHLKKIKAKEAIEKLMDGLSGPPVTILFASDGGNAENVAKRIGRRGKARGLKPKILAMDDFPIEDLANEKNLIFCTSTAGQGEFPQNGREMWDTIKNSTDLDLSGINYTVFALGDSHYWPRKEDKLYYNKPGKDLDARLEVLGANRLVPVGLGDDQDPDGFETGYNLWEPPLWSALGADQVDADFEEPKPLTNEDIKIDSNFLRGTIAEGLADTSTGAITESDAQLTKFHGTYMQDDRDLRDERKAQGLEPAYSFMVRVRMSGGVCQPEQWIAMDTISDQWGNQTFKLVRPI
jgi:sulfite reductase (NADPH) hemoprotein beta-component